MKIQASDRLIIALDSATVVEAQQLVDKLDGLVRFYKVGLVMQLAEGTDVFVRSLISSGKKVFLDYKYYDVPETLRKAVGRAAKTGVSFLTIHGSGRLIRAAVEAKGDSELRLLTVTVLTSMDSIDMQEMGYTNHTPEELVLFRTRKALEAGCDGVIASGREAEKVKALSGGKLLVVTPGIRPEGYPEDDQKRTVTPGQAILAGADYLVVGRPITGDAAPRARAQEFINEMQAAFDKLDAAGSQ
ncbi:MAG TPA: orotidine-5'-phosphate decarboxylase [Bryobacteraceae bacterium]|nr:orotidine-5'-phosphate decarboxylase [Bryobacteraceae bacterium]HPT28422.1 orotidine-5'-phosphate decarboxylase [Bryobacteraceae bacterium]